MAPSVCEFGGGRLGGHDLQARELPQQDDRDGRIQDPRDEADTSGPGAEDHPDLLGPGIDIGIGPGPADPGRKILNLIRVMRAGAKFMDDCDVLKSGSTRRALFYGVNVPAIVGTFPRA